MLDDSKNALGLARWQRVVKGRSQVKEDDSRAEDTCAGNECSVSVSYCMRDEKRSPNECSYQCYTVTDAVRDFFPSRLFTLALSQSFRAGNRML